MAALPDQIAALESEQASLGEQLSDPSIFADTAKVQVIQQRLQQLEAAIDEAMNLWSALEAKQSV